MARIVHRPRLSRPAHLEMDGFDSRRLVHYYTGPNLFKANLEHNRGIVRALTGAPLFKSSPWPQKTNNTRVNNANASHNALSIHPVNQLARSDGGNCKKCLKKEQEMGADADKWLPVGLLADPDSDSGRRRNTLRKTTSWNCNAFSSYFERASPTPAPTGVSRPFSLFPKSSDSDILSSVRNELMDKKRSADQNDQNDNNLWIEDALQGLQIRELRKTSRKF